MDEINGMPDGYQFNRNTKHMSEGARIQEKQQETLNEIYKAMPANVVKGVPIQYGDDGLPIIENDPLQQQYERSKMEVSLEQQMQNVTLRQSQQQSQVTQQQQPQQPSAQQPVDPSHFFNAPPVRQQRQQQQQQQQPQQPVQPQQQNAIHFKNDLGNTSYHPVVKKMLNIFGLKKNSRHNLEIYNENTGEKIIYTMTLVNEELQTWAMSEGKAKMVLKPEVGTVYFELLFGCCSVIAIDHTPVWEIFNVDLQNDEQVFLDADPLDMSLRIREVCARQLAALLWSETIPFGDKLLEFYQEKVIGKKIQSSLDKETIDRIRYVCPLDDCENYEFFKPVFENGIEKKYFCKFDAKKCCPILISFSRSF